MKRTTALCLLVCALVAALAGCNRQQSQPGASGKRLRLAFVTNNASPFWAIARRGTEKAAKEMPNVEVDFRIPGQADPAEQKRLIDDLIARGVDGIAISPINPANQTQMINDAAKQVLVITQDSDAPQSDRACYLGTDNRAAGRQAGELIKQALPNGGKVMAFVGQADAQNAKERFEGIKDALAGTNIQIIDLRTDNNDRVRAKANVSDTLVNYPDVGALVGLWDYNGPAILSAVKDANKVGQVKIVAFDEQEDTLKGVKDGSIVGTVVQQPFEFGYQSIKDMAQIIGGDRSVIPASKQIFIPTKVINKDNVDEFSQQLKQLLGGS